MSYCFHKRESMYPPKGFSYEIKGRKFLIHARGGYCGQLAQVVLLQKQNSIFTTEDAARDICMPEWCAMRPELCTSAGQPKKAASKKAKAVPGVGKKQAARRSCCGGGRVR